MLEKRKTVFTYIRYNVDQIQNIFYPIRYDQDCMILELKVDHKPEEAIAQIKEKEYALRFQGKTAERKRYLWGMILGSIYWGILMLLTIFSGAGTGSGVKGAFLTLLICAGSSTLGAMVTGA